MPLGHCMEDMDRFGGHEFRLDVVHDLFHDVTEVPRVCGEIGDTLLENHEDPAAIATYCYQLLEYEGREPISVGAENDTGGHGLHLGITFDSPEDEANWQTLPQAIQDFVNELVEATIEGSSKLQNAFDKQFIADSPCEPLGYRAQSRVKKDDNFVHRFDPQVRHKPSRISHQHVAVLQNGCPCPHGVPCRVGDVARVCSRRSRERPSDLGEISQAQACCNRQGAAHLQVHGPCPAVSDTGRTG